MTNENGGHKDQDKTAKEGIELKNCMDTAEQYMGAIEDCLQGGIAHLRMDDFATIIYFSDALIHMFGYSRDEIEARFGDRFCEMIHPDDYPDAFKQMVNCAKSGEPLSSIFRVMKKNGYDCWVMCRAKRMEDECGKPFLYCIFIDITNEKKTVEALRQSEARYRAAAVMNRNIVFEYDFLTKMMRFSSSYHMDRNVSGSIHDPFHAENEFFAVKEEDLPLLEGILDRAQQGVHHDEVELHMQLEGDEGYVWYRLQVSNIFGDYGKPRKMLGIITNIDHIKQREASMQELIQRDALTGLYNKTTCESLARSTLEQEELGEQHAMYIIDIDDFKKFNDTKGHLYGDEVLMIVAKKIAEQFRSYDVVGRMGGDEFVVLMRDIKSMDIVERKAQDIIQSLECAKLDIPVSCSIGVAIYPNDGDTFRELFSHADNALYAAKNEGKKRYRLYNENMPAESFSALRDVREDPVETGTVEQNISNAIFRVLYDAQDISAAVKSILKMVGQYYNVSRAYVFEPGARKGCYSNTYEWCNEGIQLMQESGQNLPEGKFGNMIPELKTDGIFGMTDRSQQPPVLNDLMKEHKVYSMLCCAIMDKGKFCGFVGFDECVDNRLWTKNEIATLLFVSQLLSVFLFKMRVTEQLEQATMLEDTVDYEKGSNR